MKLFLLILSAVVAAEAVFNGYGIPYTPDLTNPDPDFPFRIGRVSKRQFGFLERLFAWFKKPTQDSSDNSSGSPYDIPNHYADIGLPFLFNPAGKRQMQLDPWTEALLARLRKAKQNSPDASIDKANQNFPNADLDHYVDVALPFPFNPAGKRQMQLDPWTEALLARLRKAKKDSPDAVIDVDHMVSKRRLVLPPIFPGYFDPTQKIAKQDSPDATINPVLPPTFPGYLDALKKGEEFVIPDNVVNLMDRFGIVSKRHAE
ncbi:hypothetical protein RRG08_064179 [Elysia crispata]|uniref:Uncharacterized protein n=1 Tax=Elysia crispata TaxID=231223 RepID=A0AAE0YG75_9GAST|nr:hypothetical protein RRG08_064179 [Elysia crispata]